MDGVILGIAFKAVVDSFDGDILSQLIGAMFKIPDFSHTSQSVNGTQIYCGKTIQALIQFVLVAGSLLLMVKLLMRIGLNFRAQGNRECDCCKSFIPMDASKCMFCTSEIEPVVSD